ncbi:DUF4350 domain-containing protein [Flavobacterium arcticum]|uniref:DUF4350 domain-containing protein n=1 Tax=Flavobacterium arcticum TaxID=1784713 RepID=A0A345HEE2_9FLAO|nr:DUF4350 domain-containing protein [Flavobacterium arcticum]AXG74952.1 DUF4350 domain-containing protein [Flavobacterium arcticum]KAF2506505.1 DUF4350 domain-containing protein [Flavobacterium arcticum]
MNKQLTLYIVLLVVLIGAIIAIDAAKPKPIDWTPSYKIKDKKPLGLYVFDKEIDALFEGQEVEKFNITPYEFLDTNYDYDVKDYTAKGTFINISEKNEIDEESIAELMYYAEYGNTVFMSMKSFPQVLLDTLKVTTETSYYFKDSLSVYIAKSTSKPTKYYFDEGVGFTHFSSIDTLTTTVLGYQEYFDKKQANYIRVPYGNGSFLLHTQPATFSNFYLLKDNYYEYTQSVLSYIPEDNIYWNTGYNERLSGSSLRYLLSQPGFKSAYYIGLIAILIFMIFNAKRKQRIVPEIPPVRNTTVDFAKTIGNLYYQEGNHHTIIEKKIIYFLEKMRTDYLIETHTLDEAFIEKTHLKTGKPVEDIEKAVHLIKKYRHQFESTEAEVIAINKAIEKLRL